jgi:4-aminobutyrate aminotransferase-like enzyme/Ser/Thr protein kinase RdoA (MazF antagonist)
MSTVAADRPHLTVDGATELVGRLYGIHLQSCVSLPSERDQNFHLGTDTNESFVLKISSAAEDRSILDLQHQAMEVLGKEHQTGIWPSVTATSEGESIGEILGEGGGAHMVRLLTYVPGIPLAETNPHTKSLLNDLGEFLGGVTGALTGFTHTATQRSLKWNIDNGPEVVREGLQDISDPDKRELVAGFLRSYEDEVVPELSSLRRSVIHNDANDHNVLIGDARQNKTETWEKIVVGLIDFGDMVESYTIAELAVALAYVMLGKSDPLAAAASVVEGYHREFELTELEIRLLYHMACMRICMSVAISASQQRDEPDNQYLSVSESTGWELLQHLESLPANMAQYVFRDACGLPPCTQTAQIMSYLNSCRGAFAPVMGPDYDLRESLVFDLSIGSLELSLLKDRHDVHELTDDLFGRMRAAGAEVGIGRYNEARQVYTADQFAVDSDEMPETRTIHLGIDLFLPAESPVYAPLDGIVHSYRNNTDPLDYGPTIILEHRTEGNVPFYTLYGHLAIKSLDGKSKGMAVQKGDLIGWLGDYTVNGGWPPHLHFQIVTDMLGREGEFPGVGAASRRQIWLNLAPGPNVIVGVPEDRFPPEERTKADLLRSRQRHLGRSLSISYETPLEILRGAGQYLFDEVGHGYLDAVNNVPHVGHCHPRVVQAGQRQAAVLNTNTRYLHQSLVQYAERLCGTMPPDLNVCFLVNSGSEANDLALRMARAYTGRRDMIVVDGAYHGNLTSLIELSPYKFDGPGGQGLPARVHKALMPDPYRGRFKGYSRQAAESYADDVQTAINQIHQQARELCGFIAESILGCGGQVVLPDGYLDATYHMVREAGGVCIADEVQVGFGRPGSHFWGFESQNVVPDIVTLGKPIGNGHPLGAVVTTEAIADAFANGMEYFNTFGGNAVSCAIGTAVLDVVQDEHLQQNALHVGNHMIDGLRGLMAKHEIIGDVRGLGLFVGAELVLDRSSQEPAGEQASYVANRMKDHGILISTDGPLHNVLKIKPPMVFSEANADRLVATLAKILHEDFVQI